MLLSEILGVERDTDFKVKGYEPIFRITLNVNGIEHLKFKSSGSDAWETPVRDTIFKVISIAPDGIIHLPPPLTDEQREQLKAIWTLGGRWLAKDFDDVVNYYTHKPHKESEWWYIAKNDDGRYGHRIPLSSAVCKLQELDKKDEPYDIGKALGVRE